MSSLDTLQFDYASSDEAHVERHPLRWPGFQIEMIEIHSDEPYGFHAEGDWHYLALHDLTLQDGELLIDGLPRLHQTDLRDTLTFAPRGCTIHGWSKPTARKNSFTALYFDPLQLRDDLGERYATHDLGPFAYARDPALAATMRKLRDVAVTSIVDGLYAEILCLSAALEIFGVSVQGEGKLSRRQLQAVYDFVEANLAERINLDDLAKLAGLSRSHFSRTFTATTGVGPHQFVRQRQLARARSLLAEQRDLPIDTIAKAVGFGSANVFRRAFQQAHGASPQVYRRDKL